MGVSPAKKIIILILVIVVVVFVYILINTFFITKDYLYGPPLLFLQNRYISVDIYPRGRQSVTVFTNNYIEGTTTAEDIDFLRIFLKKKGVKGVFFVIPDYARTYPLSKSPLVVEELKKLKNDGHEIAQAGTYHTYGPDIARGAEPGEELIKLSFDEQLERIEDGKMLLTELGFPPEGFRAPSFRTNRETFRVLESLDFLYSSNSLVPPRTFNTLLRPSLTRGILYPHHPPGFELLEFTDYVDPTYKYTKCLRLFKRVHSLRGVFVYHTFIGNIAQPKRLQLLDNFLEAVQSENTWCCTLSEISQWCLARERLRVETKKDGQIFSVVLSNRTPFPLSNLGVKFLKFPYGVKEYVITDQQDIVLAQGKLPVQDKIIVSIPGNPES